MAAAITAAAAAGCGGSKEVTYAADYSDDPSIIELPAIAPLQPAAVMPKARIYRTSAPSDSLVPITISPSGNFVTSYPAPTDLTALPVKLAEGWLLDRRGISPQSVFTRYTYADYKALPEAPSTDLLMRSVNPSVSVTEIVELPVAIGSATPAMADSLIRAGLPGCKVIFKR